MMSNLARLPLLPGRLRQYLAKRYQSLTPYT